MVVVMVVVNVQVTQVSILPSIAIGKVENMNQVKEMIPYGRHIEVSSPRCDDAPPGSYPWLSVPT